VGGLTRRFSGRIWRTAAGPMDLTAPPRAELAALPRATVSASAVSVARASAAVAHRFPTLLIRSPTSPAASFCRPPNSSSRTANQRFLCVGMFHFATHESGLPTSTVSPYPRHPGLPAA